MATHRTAVSGNRPDPHVFDLDHSVPADPYTGAARCRCGLPKGSDVHDYELPDASEAAVEAARRIGERGEG